MPRTEQGILKRSIKRDLIHQTLGKLQLSIIASSFNLILHVSAPILSRTISFVIRYSFLLIVHSFKPVRGLIVFFICHPANCVILGLSIPAFTSAQILHNKSLNRRSGKNSAVDFAVYHVPEVDELGNKSSKSYHK